MILEYHLWVTGYISKTPRFVRNELPDFPNANISPGNDGITGSFPFPLPDILILLNFVLD